ncbi:hypothetical protein Nepgr_027379 [Nepenthes gracilis]|uniref:Uncharacterized protein n=1 Tax=Nepenthes gracilis TaxID=150966 RepID=A0AAD3TB95_NEPGR|nr:hypothetical protein Nepgr_027379 [Nepenthes gracilis]
MQEVIFAINKLMSFASRMVIAFMNMLWLAIVVGVWVFVCHQVVYFLCRIFGYFLWLRQHNSRIIVSVFNANDGKPEQELAAEIVEVCEEKGVEAFNSLFSDDDDEIEVVVRQMKQQIRSLKPRGLPAILEESKEYPMMNEGDLKPFKIEEKLLYKDKMGEIQRFYKSYLQKMKKLDILREQTMHAIGIFEQKIHDHLATKRKLSSLVMKSFLSQSSWSCMVKKCGTDQMQILRRDLQEDLERVYVGQLCLSWEFLKWQYRKAVKLQEDDSSELHQYNLTAREFQQFQVRLERFMEEGQFQGPRILTYSKSQRILCKLLHIPPIKDDPVHCRKGEGEDAITIGRLAEIIEESMHAFLKLLHTDKYKANLTLKRDRVDLEDPSHKALLTSIRKNLRKKERRLKALLTSKNCILKRFKMHQNDKMNLEQFLAEVELRLVSRALKMSRLTKDQLLWCQENLSRIDFLGKKIVHVDSTFLFFPC